MKSWFIYRVFQVIQLATLTVCTLFMRVYGWLWGVETPGNLKFYGVARYLRHPSAKILIGQNVTFRSSVSSNSMGINRACFLSAGENAILQIGDDCGFSGAVISANQHIEIGQRVMCGVNVTITDCDRHPLDAVARFEGHPGVSMPVKIGDDVWLGMNVIVLKGVHIGDGSVVAANSVVTKDIPAGSLAAGQPAKVVRAL